MFTWGGGGSSYNKGQCGHGHLKDTEYPTQVEQLADHKVVSIAAGGFHNLAATVEDKVFSWGSGIYGQCGHG